MAELENGETQTRQRMRVLQEAFAEQLPNRIKHIGKDWRSLLERDRSAAALQSLQMKVRSLASSSGSFGFASLGDAARRLELLLKGVVVRPEALTPEQAARIEKGVSDLKQACLEFTGASEVEVLDLSTLDLAITRERASRVIFLITGDSQLAADLGFELGCFGFLVRRIPDLEDLERHLDQTRPAAILLDAEPFEERMVEATWVNALRQNRDGSIPMFVLASRTDFESRLEAVRSGGDAYLVKPLEARKLIEKLEVQLKGPLSEPYRVLIVEEDYSASLDYSLTLQGAGMTTTQVHDPMKLWESLVDVRPDLIMISLSLAGISGFQLAAVIRQQDAYMEIPIVLLSAESGLGRQVEAMRVEADDVLMTPVTPDVLISVVGNHVQRARALKRFVSTDSLTGLLSHTSFLARLVLEVDRALAGNGQLAFAMIDIDHLHAINETYGHLSGDSALANLAGLLKQRLRRSDVLSRYGGDEIAVLMPATSGHNAAKVLDGICGLYAEIREYSANAAYFPTFSCGVAALPGYEDCSALRQAALDALDSARRQGRNRVILVET